MAYKINTADIKKLREGTGAGIVDCKKSLIDAKGDFQKAVEMLRKKGLKIAAKRAGRESSEGVVIAKTNEDNNLGYLLSLNCETDFVSKNQDFIDLAMDLINLAFDTNSDSLESFLNQNFKGITVAEKLIEQTGVIGEKIQINSFESLKAKTVGSYVHSNNKIAALVGFSNTFDNSIDIGKNISMQVVAMNPIAIDKNSVPQEVIDKELEIGKDLAIKDGKPIELASKIAQSRLNKFFKEKTLVAQEYIKESKVSVEQYLIRETKGTSITDFKRYALA